MFQIQENLTHGVSRWLILLPTRLPCPQERFASAVGAAVVVLPVVEEELLARCARTPRDEEQLVALLVSVDVDIEARRRLVDARECGGHTWLG